MLLYDRLLQVFKAQKEEFMLVYDANANSGSNAGFECTYTTFKSDNSTASPENPILVLDNSEKKWDETSYGLFTNPYKKTAFDFQINGESFTSNILKIDSRFTSLIKWLGENRIKVKHLKDIMYTRFRKLHLAMVTSYPLKTVFFSL